MECASFLCVTSGALATRGGLGALATRGGPDEATWKWSWKREATRHEAHQKLRTEVAELKLFSWVF